MQPDATTCPHRHAQLDGLLQEDERLGAAHSSTALTPLGDETGGAGGDSPPSLPQRRDFDQHRTAGKGAERGLERGSVGEVGRGRHVDHHRRDLRREQAGELVAGIGDVVAGLDTERLRRALGDHVEHAGDVRVALEVDDTKRAGSGECDDRRHARRAVVVWPRRGVEPENQLCHVDPHLLHHSRLLD